MTRDSLPISGRSLVQLVLVVGLVGIVLPFVITGVPAIVGAEESYVVLSGSMSGEPKPDIQPGDVIIVDGVDPSAIEEGDIITYRAGDGKPITHRVIDVQRQEGALAFQTKGDANEDADAALVPQDQVVGEVMVVFPYIGHVVNFVKTPLGFALVVAVPIGLLLLSEIWSAVGAGYSPPDESTGTPGGSRSAQSGGSDADPVTDGKIGGATVGTGDRDDGGGGPSTVTLKQGHLAVAAVLLAPTAIGTGYLAYTRQTVWAVTATYATTALFLASVGLYLRMAGIFAGDGAANVSSQPPQSGGALHDRLINGRIDDLEATDRITVTVTSVAKLLDMARKQGSWVVDEADTTDYYLVTDEVVFKASDSAACESATPMEVEKEEPDGEEMTESEAIAVDADASRLEYSSLGEADDDSATTNTNGDTMASDPESVTAMSEDNPLGDQNVPDRSDVDSHPEQDDGPTPRPSDDQPPEEGD